MCDQFMSMKLNLQNLLKNFSFFQILNLFDFYSTIITDYVYLYFRITIGRHDANDMKILYVVIFQYIVIRIKNPLKNSFSY